MRNRKTSQTMMERACYIYSHVLGDVNTDNTC